MPAVRLRIPPPVLAIQVIAIYVFVDVGLPVGLSRITDRHGWDGLSPGWWNLFGLVPLIAGLVVVVAAGGAHARAWRARSWQVVKIDREHLLTPDYLVTDGMYHYSRNPLYVGDLTMWLGWCVFLGSVPTALGAVAFALAFLVGVRLEERGLARQFGDDWSAYARSTPRFLGHRGAG